MEVRKKSLLLETLKYQLNLLTSSKEEKLIKTITENNGIEISEVQLPEKVI